MNIDSENINKFLNRYVDFVEEICDIHNYNINIKHFLYLIIPSFIIKYGINFESTILKCFKDTRIIVSDEDKTNVLAAFNRILEKNNETYFTKKYVIIYNFSKANYISLLDSLVHEFNHAVNSMLREIEERDNTILVRSGIFYITYSKNNLSFPIKTENSLILEEIINTSQTESIINIILSFNKYHIENTEFNNLVYSLQKEIVSDKFKSKSYEYVTTICKNLLNSKTFMYTIVPLRFKGFIKDIEYWFNSIAGSDKYKELIDSLNEIVEIDKSLSSKKWFKQIKINKAISLGKEVIEISKKFDNNSY